MVKSVMEKRVSAEENGLRLDRCLRLWVPHLPQSVIEKAARKGSLKVEGNKAKPSDRLAEGQILSFPSSFVHFENQVEKKNPAVLTNADKKWLKKLILYEDSELLVLNKPAGIAVQGGTNQRKSLDAMLLEYEATSESRESTTPKLETPSNKTQRISRIRVGDRAARPMSVINYVTEGESRESTTPKLENRRVRLVHRLDKDTSGILVFAKTLAMAQWLTQAFKERTVQKMYWALVCGVPQQKEGMISLALSKKPDPMGEKVRVDEEEGLKAITTYRVIEAVGNRVAWLELTPQTGRTHQLRVHCAEGLKTPIIGDGKYGGKEAFLLGRKNLHLHARRLVVPLPQGRTMTFEAPLPQDMAETFRELGFERWADE